MGRGPQGSSPGPLFRSAGVVLCYPSDLEGCILLAVYVASFVEPLALASSACMTCTEPVIFCPESLRGGLLPRLERRC